MKRIYKTDEDRRLAKNERERLRRVQNPDKARASVTKWRENNPEKNSALAKVYRKGRRHKDIVKERIYRGLPLPTRPTPAACECCGGPPGKKSLHLDHCHETNNFRGWLCNKCNAGIGMLGDDVDGVAAAMSYLLRKP